MVENFEKKNWNFVWRFKGNGAMMGFYKLKLSGRWSREGARLRGCAQVGAGCYSTRPLSLTTKAWDDVRYRQCR